MGKDGGVKNPTDHFTGRFCHCGGALLNSTIDFGQDLPRKPLDRARQHSKRADLHLALGSSLRVSPACDQPANTAARGGELVVCNLQRTPLTESATMHIFAPTDVVMEMLMDRLNMPIPQFRLLRRLVVGKCDDAEHIYAKAVDVHDPSLMVSHVCGVDWNGKGVSTRASRDSSMASNFQHSSHRYKVGSSTNALEPTFHFHGHYNEPPLQVNVDLGTNRALDLMLSFDPYGGEWTVLSQSLLNDGELQPPDDAVEARIPEYGESQRQYCIDMAMKAKNCDLKTATEIIENRFKASRQEARAQAGLARKKVSHRK